MFRPEHIVMTIRSRRFCHDTYAQESKAAGRPVARRLIGDADHFWQKRYYDFNVRNHAQFVEKLHYIHWNPVKKGLCERPRLAVEQLSPSRNGRRGTS